MNSVWSGHMWSARLCLLGARITGMNHHTQTGSSFFPNMNFYIEIQESGTEN